jgi:catechol 2,3-dioxygenase-like lactoylglutathione lyase family enzyme
MRAFPVVYVESVARSQAFWERLGFEAWYSLPEGDDPGYVSLRRDEHYIAVTKREWPEGQGIALGTPAVFEMFVYVADVDALIPALEADGIEVVQPPTDMPWGERVAMVRDPDGNPVSLARPLDGTHPNPERASRGSSG